MLFSEEVKSGKGYLDWNSIKENLTPIIVKFLSGGEKRFPEIWKISHYVSKSDLTKRLEEMEDEGLIERGEYIFAPCEYIYGLTEKGWASLQMTETRKAS